MPDAAVLDAQMHTVHQLAAKRLHGIALALYTMAIVRQLRTKKRNADYRRVTGALSS